MSIYIINTIIYLQYWSLVVRSRGSQVAFKEEEERKWAVAF